MGRCSSRRRRHGRPAHPHIGLATVTFLFEGEIDHKDSLGTAQSIAPGDVNWMTAGRGIAHSERSSPALRRAGVRLHGIQSWVALPVGHEEAAPSFIHYPAASIPRVSLPGVELDVIAGAWGVRSPVAVLWPTLYAHARLEDGARLPSRRIERGERGQDEHEERAVYWWKAPSAASEEHGAGRCSCPARVRRRWGARGAAGSWSGRCAPAGAALRVVELRLQLAGEWSAPGDWREARFGWCPATSWSASRS